MALNRISIGIVGRGNTGRLTARSAVAAAAYEAREALFDEQRGRVHDYTADRADLVHDEILLPKVAPYRWFDREVLWNEVEAREVRRDAQVARSVILTLPRELDVQAGTALAREYFQDTFVRRGMIVDMAVHTKDARDGEPQPHAHALLTMRRIVNGAFGLKETAWNKVSAIREWREQWAEMAGRRLAEHGVLFAAHRAQLAEVATLARAAAIIGAAVMTHAAREAVRRVVPARRERKQQDMPTNKLAQRTPIEELREGLRQPLRAAAVGVATGAWTYGQAVDTLVGDHLLPAIERHPELNSRFEELEERIGNALTRSVTRVERQISGNTAILRARAEHREVAMTDEQYVARIADQLGVPNAAKVDRLMRTPEVRAMEASVEERIAASSTGEAGSLSVERTRRVVPAAAAARHEAQEPSRRAQQASQRSHVAVME